MALSQELLSQFAKLTNNENKVDSINVKGTYKKINGIEYVQLDGSDIWTPVTSTVEAETGERVTVTIKDHNATVTGNISSPSARTKSVQDLKDEVDEYGNTIKQLDNSIEQQGNSIIQIENNINQQQNTINQHGNLINQQKDTIISIGNDVIAQNNEIEALNNDITLQGNVIDSMNNTITEHGNTINSMDNMISQQGNVINQQSNIINQQGNIINQHGNTINEVNSNITILNSGFVIDNGVITGLSGAVINDLKTNTLNTEYATITFSNIQMAAIQKLFTDSGIIKDLIVSQGKITGELVGVTIKGDLIEGNSIVADKLVVKGDDGLYYKLNIDGLNNISTSESGKFILLQNEPDNWGTNYKDYYIINNGNYIHVSGNNPPTWISNTYYKLSSTYESALDGTNIVAQSITADKIQVTDLVAFGATIGGFDIDTHSLHTHLKNNIDSPISGMFMDDSGQLVFGDGSNFIKYFKDTNNQWKLVIRANQISMGSSSKTIQEEFNDLENSTIKNVDVLYALGDSQTQAPTTGWSTVAPAWQSGKYMWQKTVSTFGDNTTSESDPTCISGANGQDGQPGTPGTPGTSSFTHIRYSANSDGTNFVENPTTATIYIGVYTGTSSTAPTNKSSYKWSKYKGDPGQNGSDGNGINSISYYYKATNTQTPPAASEITSTSIPTLSATNKYLWQKQVIDFTGSSVADKTTVMLLGAYGDTGGKGDKGDPGNNGTSVTITSTSVTYQASTSGTTIPTGSWQTSVPSVSNGQYLWTRTIVNYSDGTNTTSYSVAYKGTNGNKGDTGTGISSITEEFYLSTSKTSQTGGSWQTTPPAWSSGKYIWTRSKIVYTNPSSTVYTEPLCSSEWEAVNNIEIGSRNYFKKESTNTTYSSGNFNDSYEYTLNDYQNVGSFTQFGNLSCPMSEFLGKQMIITFEMISPNGNATLTPPYNTNGNPRYRIANCALKDNALTTSWKKFEASFTIVDDGTSKSEGASNKIEIYCATKMGCKIRKVKLEIGTKPTDWTPAPEDMASASDISKTRSDLTGDINQAKGNLQKSINELDNSIDGKVKESIKNGAATQAVMDLINGSFEMKFSNSASAINRSIADLLANRDTMASYIQFKDGDIILGETDSEFSLKIENDQIGIYYGNVLLSHWDTKSFIVDLLQTMELRLKKQAWNYKFTFITNDNGSVSFRRVDGE